MSKIDLMVNPIAASEIDSRVDKGAFARFLENRSASLGALLLGVIVLISIVGPFIYQVDPMASDHQPLLLPGSSDAPLLGTDGLGRDILAGLIGGGRVTLAVGALAAALSTLIGLILGAIGGYFGGAIDTMAMKITELFQVIPPVLLAIVLVAIFKPSVSVVIIAISLVTWPGTARLARAEFLRLRKSEFVNASRTMAASTSWIIFRVILPNAMPPLIVYTSLMAGASMLYEAGLSFLGLGDPGLLSWGAMLGQNRTFLLVAWWPVVFPGLAIFFAVLSVSLVGDGINDAINPRGAKR